VSRAAEKGDAKAVDFPRPMSKQPGLDFSYSGLKTAVAIEIERRGGREALSPGEVADVAASFEAAATDVLVHRVRRALRKEGLGCVAVVGGVAANRRLREEMSRAGRRDGFRVVFPPLDLCTDNAAMIAAAGARLLERGERATLDLNAFSRAPLAAAPGA
jgi:N6-L-threonylcarbamoyladenine synthase